MRHRAGLAVLAALLLAACASSGDGGSPSRSSSNDRSGPGPQAPSSSDSGDRSALPPRGVRAGWRDYRPAKNTGQVTSLTLLSQGTEEGKLISRGRARMEGGKVVDDGTAADLLEAVSRSGFDRYAVKRSPEEPVPGALEGVWIDRGNGFESLFLMRGQRQNSETREIPDVFDALKKLVLTIHQRSPGSMVITGEGWSGDSMMNQKAGGKDR